jgi:glycosyltransferase involved in cell wall biosynthesis
MTLVSVIVPVYERRHCVLDAVESVLAQTHRDVECIVVDDGSSDGTFDALVAAYADDARVRVFDQPHRGVSAARNLGIGEARGDYVTFLDSDDLMPESRIRRQLELLTERSCDAVLGRAHSYAMPGVDPPPWFHAQPEWGGGYLWITVLVATRHLRSVDGFDEALHIGEDIDLLVKLRAAGVRVVAVNETFVLHRFFGDNLTYALRAKDSSLRDSIRRHLARQRAAHG